MRRASLFAALAVGAVLAPLARAQGPVGPGPRPAPMAGMQGAGPGAGFLLAHTGDLKLTDAQVLKLAALSRRVADRQAALRARVDSAAAARRTPPRDSAARARMRQPLFNAGDAQRMREERHGDLRDALAVLTADQQASAWELVARQHARMGPVGGRRPGMQPAMQRPGMQRPRMPGGGMQPPPPARPE